ncbi:MAG: hypothetical protein AAF587_02590 [Bacteroidota bacterium]
MEDYNDKDMDTNYNDIAGIESYLDGTLKGEAQIQFQKWRTSDPESERKIAAQRLIRYGMQAVASKTYQAKVEEWEEQIKQEEAQRQEEDEEAQSVFGRFRTLMPLAIAATVLLLLLIGSRWYISQQYSNQALALANYQVVEADRLKGLRGANPEVPESNWEDCASAVPILQSIVASSPVYAQSQFALGQCLFEQQHYTAAAQAFETSINAGGKSFEQYETAYWSRVLALLASGEQSDKEILQLLDGLPPDTNQGLIRKSDRLKKDLSSVWRAIAR